MGADTAPLEQLWVDRDAEVPIGVQLAWAIRMRIEDGTLGAGQRLPGLRDLAETLGVNPNTVRAVYSRLERDGLLESRQGSGTFIAADAGQTRRAGAIAAKAAQEALQAGLDPREVASVLYVQASRPAPRKTDAGRRSKLRSQIAALEQALGDLEAEHPALATDVRRRHPAPSLREHAGLPSAEELERTKSSLLRRLGAMQAEIDALTQDDAAVWAEAAQPRRAPSRPSKSESRTSRPRAAPAGA